MKWPNILSRLRSKLLRRSGESEFDEEIKLHIELQRRKYQDAGMSAEEASRRALLDFGGLEQTKELWRDATRIDWLTNVLQDLRYACRALARAPGFAAIVISMLALGMGVNIATFSVTDALLLRMLPVKDPGSLFRMVRANGGAGDPSSSASYKVFQEMKQRVSRFAQLIAYSSADEHMIAIDSSEAERLVQQTVSGNYFQVLGVQPAVGRNISSSDDAEPGRHPVAVISYSFWKQRFDGTPKVLGHKLKFQNRTFDIIGVAPPRFFGVEVGKAIDVWTPIAMAPPDNLTNDHMFWLQPMGRLSSGATIARASGPMQAVMHEFMLEDVRQHAPTGTPQQVIDRFLAGTQIKGVPAGGGISYLRQEYRQPLQIMMFVVTLVLLIACTSVANLLIAKAGARQQEIAVRLSLGAGRARVLQQLITESLLLGLISTFVALLLAHWATPLLIHLLGPSNNPAKLDTSIDLRLLLFTVLICVTTVLICGVLPALRLSGGDIYPALKSGGRLVAAGRMRARKVLVTCQVALSLVLLIAAVLFSRTLLNLTSVYLGFDPDRVLVARLGFQASGAERNLSSAWAELLRRVRLLPGVGAASLSSASLFSGSPAGMGIRTAISTTHPADPITGVLFISSDHFRTLGIQFVKGRDFELRDNIADAPRAVIINETFSRKFFGNANPIGQKLTKLANAPQWAEIVGVVRDTKYNDVRETPSPFLYIPYGRVAEWIAPQAHPGLFMSVELLGRGSIFSLRAGLRREAGPQFSILEMTAQRQLIDDTLIRQKLLAGVAGVFGVLALALAVLGLYGLMSYTVVQRRREIGIRMALGAAPSSVLKLIVGDSALIVGAGVLVGALLAFLAAGFAKSLIYGLAPNDPQTFLIASFLLIAASLLAAFLPAYKAARIDPMTALRYE